MSMIFKASAEPGRRLVSVQVNGRDVEDRRRYTIAGCEREGEPLDMVCRHPGTHDARVLPMTIHQALKQYFKAHPLIAPHREDRGIATDLPRIVFSQDAALSGGDLSKAPTTPSGLSGPALRPWQWTARAAEVGLSAYPGAATTNTRRAPPPSGAVPRPELLPMADETALAQLGLARPLAHAPRLQSVLPLLVLGDRVVGDGVEICGADAAAGCVRLARAVDAELLAVYLAQAEGNPRWRFLAADARPQMEDEPTLAALTGWIESRA
jgi:hypothetical protein